MLEDRFDIDPPLHVGQIATVYPAVQKGLGRRALLKVVNRNWLDDAELVERFNREGVAIAKIDHPNVVKVYEYGSEDGVPYLALEWIDGGTLKDRLKDGPLPQHDVKAIGIDLLRGLEAVHEEGLLHRDIKPDNILLGADGRVRLADFSLAGFDRSPGLTGHGAMVGSPAYMAPELTLGKPASPQSDLYGLGVTLLESLTGSNPFAASDPLVSLDLVRRKAPPRLAGKPQFERGLAELVDALLEKDERLRPASAARALGMVTGAKDSSTPLKPALQYTIIGTVAACALLLMVFTGKPLVESNIQPSSFNPPAADTALAPAATADSTFEPPSMVTSKPVSAASVAAPVSYGYLTLIARPWAEVEIDGEGVGVTPIGTIKMNAGTHEVILRHPQFPLVRHSIEVRGGAADTLAVDLRSTAAQVTMSAVPWGYLSIDGDSIGLLPRPGDLWLAAGRHSIAVEHPLFDVLFDTLDLVAGSWVKVRVNFNDGTMIATEDLGQSDSTR